MGLLDKLFRPPSPDRFAEMIVAAIREAGDRREIQYNSSEFSLTGDDGSSINLANIYREYCAVPRSDRQDCLKRLTRGLLSHYKELPEEFEDAKCDLRPRVWARSTHAFLELQNRLDGGESLSHPRRPIGEHLEETLVFDFPESVRSISHEDLKQWGVSPFEAMEIARENLSSGAHAFASLGGSLYASMTGDTYDASRLLLVDVIRQFQVKGDPIAMVPNRDKLLVTGSEDEEGLTLMLALAEKALKDEPRPLVGTALRLVGDEWEDWMPPPAHPRYQQFRNLELQWIYGEYADQKKLLDAIYQKEEEDSQRIAHSQTRSFSSDTTQ